MLNKITSSIFLAFILGFISLMTSFSAMDIVSAEVDRSELSSKSNSLAWGTSGQRFAPQNAQMTNQPLVNLTLFPPSQTVGVGGNLTITVQAQCGAQTTDGIDLYLDFDPAYLSIQSSIPGTSLSTILAGPRWDNIAGTYGFSAGQLTGPFPGGNFDVVTITFHTKIATSTSTPTAITFHTLGSTQTLVDSGGTLVTGSLYGGNYSISSLPSPIITITSSPNPSVFGQQVTFTANVNAPPAAGTPTGTVTFKDGLLALAKVMLNASAVVTYSTTAFSPGYHNISVEYEGDTAFAPNTSAMLHQQIWTWGDANGDTKVNIGDITKVERVILGLDPETCASDANKDNKVNIGDVTKIERIILGLDHLDFMKTWSAPPALQIDTSKNYFATVDTTLGTFKIQLFANETPITVNNFIFLSQQGFYNDVIFHRIIKTFVIQTGDPTGTGTGGPGYAFIDELPTQHSYDPGIVAMANAGPNTNGSQFFIVTGPDAANLNNYPNYTQFGKVIDGMDVIQNIAGVPVFPGNFSENSRPINPPVINNIVVTSQ